MTAIEWIAVGFFGSALFGGVAVLLVGSILAEALAKFLGVK